jgi:hypothetical protein
MDDLEESFDGLQLVKRGTETPRGYLIANSSEDTVTSASEDAVSSVSEYEKCEFSTMTVVGIYHIFRLGVKYQSEWYNRIPLEESDEVVDSYPPMPDGTIYCTRWGNKQKGPRKKKRSKKTLRNSLTIDLAFEGKDYCLMVFEPDRIKTTGVRTLEQGANLLKVLCWRLTQLGPIEMQIVSAFPEMANLNYKVGFPLRLATMEEMINDQDGMGVVGPMGQRFYAYYDPGMQKPLRIGCVAGRHEEITSSRSIRSKRTKTPSHTWVVRNSGSVMQIGPDPIENTMLATLFCEWVAKNRSKLEGIESRKNSVVSK